MEGIRKEVRGVLNKGLPQDSYVIEDGEGNIMFITDVNLWLEEFVGKKIKLIAEEIA